MILVLAAAAPLSAWATQRGAGLPAELVIHWGGDEFLLLLTCTANEARRKAGELKAAFEQERRIAVLGFNHVAIK